MTAPGGGNAAAVWVSVLPDLSGFGRRLIDELGEAGQRGGQAAGERAESAISKAAKGFAIAGAAAGAALAAGLVGAINVEKANDKLAAQLGLTEKESARVGGVAGSLFSNAYGGSLEEVNGAVGAVISSIDGMRTASSSTLDAVSRNALDFASAFDVDVQSAVSSVGLLMKSGLATDATEGFDLITAASQRVPAALREDVLEASNEYGQFFGVLGFSGEQAFATLVDASAKGQFGLDKIGDAVKEFTIRSTDMSTASTEAYQAIGLDAESMANKILAGGDTAQGATQQIIDGLLSMTNPSEQAAAAIALFGTPLEDLNVTEIPAFLQSMQGASTSMDGWRGSTERMGQALNDNAATNIESFKRQVTTAFIDIVGGRVLPIVSGFAALLATSFGPALSVAGGILTGTVIPAVQTFGRFVADNQVPIGIVAGLIAAVFIPHLVALGVQSTIAGVRSAAAWVMTQGGAIRAAAVHSAQVVLMIGRWAVLGAQSLLYGGRVAMSWLLVGGINALAATVATTVAVAQMIARWVLLGAQSLVQAARVVAAWLVTSAGAVAAGVVMVAQVALMIGRWVLLGVQSIIQAGRVVAAWVVTQVAAVGAGVIMVAQVAVMVARWVFLGAQSLIQAGRVAAAWLIAMGPIGLVIAAVVGLVALIILNWDKIKSATKSLTENIGRAFEWVVDKIGRVWAGIKALLAKPINFLIGTVYNGGIVKAWNFVAGLIPGIGPIKEMGLIPEFARGGPVMSDQIIRAGEAGPEYVLSAPAVAGLGGMGAVEELHRQAVRNPISLRELNTGRYVEGADHDGPGARSSGFGGVKPHVARAGHYLKQRFGVSSVGGVGQRAGKSDHPRGLALDFMTYSDQGKGDRLVNYLTPNAGHFGVKYIIWKQRINSGSGWKSMADRGSPTANHFDHPHVSFLDGPGGDGGFSGEGGEAWYNPLPGMVRGFFDSVVNPLVNAIPGGPPKFLDIPKGLAGSARDEVLKFVLGLVGGNTMDRGGLAYGKGFIAKDTIKPERVLDPRQTVAFERLVASLPTASTASLPGSAVPAELAPGGTLDRKLTELIDAVRAQPRHGPMTVQTAGDPVETARAVQLALRP